MSEIKFYIEYEDITLHIKSGIGGITSKAEPTLLLSLFLCDYGDIETLWSIPKARELAGVIYQLLDSQSSEILLTKEVAQKESPLEDHEWRSNFKITRKEEQFILILETKELDGFDQTLETSFNLNTAKDIADAITNVIEKLEKS